MSGGEGKAPLPPLPPRASPPSQPGAWPLQGVRHSAPLPGVAASADDEQFPDGTDRPVVHADPTRWTLSQQGVREGVVSADDAPLLNSLSSPPLLLADDDAAPPAARTAAAGGGGVWAERCMRCSLKERLEKMDAQAWKRVTLLLSLVSLLLLCGLIGWMVYYFYFHGCGVWLSDVRIDSLPAPVAETGVHAAATISVAVGVVAHNPTGSTASIDKAALQVTLVDYAHTLTAKNLEPPGYPAVEVLRFPAPGVWSELGNTSIAVPPGETVEAFLHARLRFTRFTTGMDAQALVRSGCFRVDVSGGVGYRLGSKPWPAHNTEVSGRMQLFGPAACPCSR